MKHLILSVFTLVMCSGCLAEMCVEEIEDQGVVQTHIDLSGSIVGGLAENDETIVLKGAGYEELRFDKLSGKRYKVQKYDIPRIATELPFYGWDKDPVDGEDAYIHVKEQDDLYLVFEIKKAGEKPEEVVVSLQTNTDPLFLKRTGLVLATPVAAAADVAGGGAAIGLGFAAIALFIPLLVLGG